MNRLLDADEDGFLAKCPCGSNRGTLADCCVCTRQCCSECGEGLSGERTMCQACVAERLLAAMADETDADEDAALDLIAQTVAHEVMMALQSDLAEISMYARAGCTPGETRAAVARDRKAN